MAMIAYKKLDEKVIFAFSGRLDTAFCLEFEEELLTRCEEAQCQVIFDLDRAEYICSTFLRVCQRAARAADAGRFEIANIPAPLYRVFKVAALDKLLAVEAP